MVAASCSKFLQLSGPCGQCLPALYTETMRVSMPNCSERFAGSSGAGADWLNFKRLIVRAAFCEMSFPSNAFDSLMRRA